MNWVDWKHAMVGYAHQHKLNIPSDFLVGSNRCGAGCRTLLEEIQHSARIKVDGVLGSVTESVLAPFLPTAVIRGKVVECARWAVTNNAGWHYLQDRPFSFGLTVPKWIDCSGSYMVWCKAGGVRLDPSGYGWSGDGNTDSLSAHMARIELSMLLPGDAVIWGSYPGTRHVAMISEPGSDPMIITHGSEGQPQEYRQSVENPYHPGEPFTYHRLTV